jgi:hypothetical protein
MKYKMKNPINLLIMIMAVGFVSCSKPHHEVEPESVKIDIVRPQLGLAYGKGDSVKMNIHITSPTHMHGYELHITRLSDNAEVYVSAEDLHEDEFDIDKTWVYDGSCNSEMELRVVAKIDHDGNKVNKAIKFYCH